MSTYVAIVKLDFVPVVNDDDEVVPGNYGALKAGLQALLNEDAEDEPRAAQKWAKAEQLLANDVNDDDGGAQSQVQVANDFHMEAVGNDGWGGYGYWPWYGGYGG